MVNVGLRGFIWEQKSVEHKARLCAPTADCASSPAPLYEKHSMALKNHHCTSPVRCPARVCCCAACRWHAKPGA